MKELLKEARDQLWDNLEHDFNVYCSKYYTEKPMTYEERFSKWCEGNHQYELIKRIDVELEKEDA